MQPSSDAKPQKPRDHWRTLCYGAVAACLAIGGLLKVVEYLGPQPRISMRTAYCKNNLKQIGLALHNYHDAYGCFPPAYVADADGRPMHSWRVLLLPYLDQEPLYKRYRFDEPWDGPTNSNLHSQILPVYCCPANPSTAVSYVAVVGEATIWPGATPARIADIRDGVSNSILVVERSLSGIHWMEPRDLELDKLADKINWPIGPAISSQHKGGVWALMCDGTVRFLENTLPAEKLRALLTIRGGETVPPD